MSDRDVRLYCADILDSGAAILEFVKDLTFEEFCTDRKTYSAVIREFEIIGEAVGNGSPLEFLLRRDFARGGSLELTGNEYAGKNLAQQNPMAASAPPEATRADNPA